MTLNFGVSQLLKNIIKLGTSNQMKQIKSFRISEENIKRLKDYSKEQDRSQSWIVNQAIELYFERYCLESGLNSTKK